ncbi:unnamed protein product [Sphagnum troendelagicum]|uniref:Uncharacterized protein n=1 Tax=Sphagnum troendelagicum TaxID=128251 RepID=A0ABP0U4J8_9BRYO
MDKQSLLALFSGAANSGWSLEEDVQLRKWLEVFAEELKRRTETVARDVQQLVEQTSVVELNLLNTMNSLQVLSATQFIENRVSEEDEASEAKRKEPQISKQRAEDYEGDILPRYKEAVLTAWRAFEGLGGRKVKRLSAAERQISYARNEMENVQQHWKLPFIIGTEEFARDSECGLADFTFVGAYSRSGTPESDSDTERDEAQMAAEMVGTGILSEGEWSAIESEGSAHQGGVLEPAVSAALDFRAMLEAALRGPSLPYEDGMLPSQENPYGQYSYVDNAPTFSANKRTSNSPRTRSESGENKTDWDLPGEAGQVLPYPDPHTDGSHLENYMSYQTPDLDLKISREIDLGDSILKTPQDEPSSPPAYAPAYDDLSKLAALVNSTVSKAHQQDPGPSTLPNQSSIHSGSSQQEWVSRSLLRPQAPPSSRNVSQASKSISAHITSMPSLSLGLFDHDSSDSQSISVQYQSQSGPMGDLAPIPTIPDELYQASHVAKSLFQEQPSSSDSGVSKSAQMETAPAKQSSQRSMEEDLTGGQLVTSSNQKGAFARSNMMDRQGSLIKQNGSSTSKASFLPRPRTERTLPFKGSLFDEDDESEDEAVNVFGQRNTVGKQKLVSNLYQRESMQRPTSSSHSSRDKKGLFDDVDESQPGHGSVPAFNAGEFEPYVTRDPLSSSPAVQGGHESPPRSQETVSDFADGQANIMLPREIALESETHMAPEQLSASSRNLSSFEYSKRIDMARTLAKAASLRGVMLQGGRPPSPPTRSRDSSSVFNEMGANSQHNRYGEGRGAVEDLQQDVNIGSLSASGSVAQSLVSPGESPPDANQIAKLVGEGLIASQTIVGEKYVKEGLEGSHSHFLVAAVTANRAPIDSDDDTSISWSNSGSEGPEEGSDESLSKQAGGQISTLRIPTDIRDGDAQQQSDLSGGAASVEEDLVPPPDNSGTNYTRDSGSEVALPEKKVQGLLSKDTRSSNLISASTGPGTSPVISPQESRAFSPTNTNRGPSLDHFLGSSVSASARASSAQSFQNIDEDLAQIHKPSSYHEGGHDIEDSSHTEMEPSDINSSLGSINSGYSNSASVGSRILFQGGGKVDKVLTPVESTPTIGARRFKSLFEDDDDEEEIFLPHLQPSRTLKGTVTDVREGKVQDLASNESMYRGGHRSLGNPLRTSRNTMVERVARRPMIIDSQVQAASLENFDEKPINPLGPDVSPQFQELMKRETSPFASNQQKSGQGISLLTSTTEDIKTRYMISTDLKKSESLSSPASAVQVPSKSTSALFFGDDNDEGEDALFGPLGGQSSKRTEHKSASLLGIEGSSRREDFAKSPIILGSVPSSSSTTVFGKALRRSLFDDAGNHPS